MEPTPLDRLMDSPRLPSIPSLAVKIVDMVQRPEISIEQLADALMLDPALAARILKTANSGFYGRPRSVTRLRDAVMVLGLRSVKSLALGFSLVSDLKRQGSGGFDHSTFWQRSLLAGTAARVVATTTRQHQSEEAFLGGLLHGLGMITLSQTLGAAYQETIRAANGDFEALREAERARFGMDHAEVGGMLAERWNLPVPLVAALRHYAAPEKAPAEVRALVRCVTTGVHCAGLMLDLNGGRALERFRSDCMDWFNLPAEEAEGLLPRIVADSSILTETLDLPRSGSISAEEVLSRANEALLQLTLETERENARLEAAHQQLATEASTDGLTGLANRRHLDEFLSEHHRIASRYRTPLSLLFLDVDNFKRFNDTYGHQAGDDILRQLANTLRAEFRDADLPARYGGEEFAVVLPSTDLRGAIECAERTRSAIEGMRVTVDGKPIGVTVSIGVSGYAPGVSLEALVHAADTALYAAKRDGRNLVRVAAAGLSAAVA